MNTVKYMNEEVVIKKAMGILIKELCPVEAIRFITMPKIKSLENKFEVFPDIWLM
ncbi:MAG: hypothetical protein PHH85_12220 [Candidatus Methanoperedens sp.]|nr:hypothetical protein [Candidatus Methanoperedens sp.]